MKVYTEVGHYKATPEVLFDLLSNPENLPKWAITFCKGIEKQEDGYYLVTAPSDDKLFFRIVVQQNAIINKKDTYGHKKYLYFSLRWIF
jgi:hypothetical protein